MANIAKIGLYDALRGLCFCAAQQNFTLEEILSLKKRKITTSLIDSGFTFSD
jgi:hypothetical protein